MLAESDLLKLASRIRRDVESTRLHTFVSSLPTILGSANRAAIVTSRLRTCRRWAARSSRERQKREISQTVSFDGGASSHIAPLVGLMKAVDHPRFGTLPGPDRLTARLAAPRAAPLRRGGRAGRDPGSPRGGGGAAHAKPPLRLLALGRLGRSKQCCWGGKPLTNIKNNGFIGKSRR